jgi:uncharacterized membrane protein (DUF2068 family)
LFLAASTFISAHGAFISVLGAVFLVLGAAALFLSIGLWRGRRWAWMTTIILQAIVLVLDLVLLVTPGGATGIVGIILSAIIIYYLTRPHVKAYFQRVVAPSM